MATKSHSSSPSSRLLGITQICTVCILKIHAPPCDIVTDKLLLWLQAEHRIQYQTQNTRLPYRAHAQKHICLPPLRMTATHSSNGLVVSRNVCRFLFPQATGQPSRAHGFMQVWLLYLGRSKCFLHLACGQHLAFYRHGKQQERCPERRQGLAGPQAIE
jgi:hypothetical protein